MAKTMLVTTGRVVFVLIVVLSVLVACANPVGGSGGPGSEADSESTGDASGDDGSESGSGDGQGETGPGGEESGSDSDGDGDGDIEGDGADGETEDETDGETEGDGADGETEGDGADGETEGDGADGDDGDSEGDGDDAEPDLYTFMYDANGADSGELPAESVTAEEGEPITVLGNTGELAKDDHTFGGWNSDPDGSGANYRAGDIYTMGSSDATVYAVWNPPLEESGNVEEAINAITHETIAGDPDNGFDALEGEDGVYQYTRTGGGVLRFWQVNAIGTFTFEAKLIHGPGNNPTGTITIYRVDPDGQRADEIHVTDPPLAAGATEFTSIEFPIPDSDFEVVFEGGQREWTIQELAVVLD